MTRWRSSLRAGVGSRPRFIHRDGEAAYKRAGVLERYRELSNSHQREYARWIEAAKQAETRQRRIEKSIAALRGQKLPKR